MSNSHMSPAQHPCYDGEQPADEAPVVEVTNTTVTETPDTQPVEETPEPEPPEPEPLFSTADLERQISERLATAEREWADKIAAKDTEVATIKARYDQATVERSLQDAAIKGDAFNAEQILPILRGHTSINADGLPVVQIENFVMSPSEAITWMRSQPDRFGNLFKSHVIAGIGGHSTAGGARAPRGQNVRGMSAEQYRAAKRENPSAFGFTEGGVG